MNGEIPLFSRLTGPNALEETFDFFFPGHKFKKAKAEDDHEALENIKGPIESQEESDRIAEDTESHDDRPDKNKL